VTATAASLLPTTCPTPHQSSQHPYPQTTAASMTACQLHQALLSQPIIARQTQVREPLQLLNSRQKCTAAQVNATALQI
jgi:hypothetical protein